MHICIFTHLYFWLHSCKRPPWCHGGFTKKSFDFKVDWVLNGCWSRVVGTMSVYTEEEKNNIQTDSRGS